MTIRARNDVVFVTIDAKQETTKSGIYLGASKVDSKITGIVEYAGSEITDIAIGDRVLLSALTYYTVVIENITYTVCREKEVLAILS